MAILTATRQSTPDELAAEMDRRGNVIERIESERDRYREALTEIRDAGTAHSMPSVDLVEAMRDIAKDAIGPRKTVWAKDDRPGGFDGPTAAD